MKLNLKTIWNVIQVFIIIYTITVIIFIFCINNFLYNKFVLYFIIIPLLLIILGYHTICFFIELRKLEKIRKDYINKVLTYSKYSFNKFNDNIEILEELEDNKKVEIEILDF